MRKQSVANMLALTILLSLIPVTVANMTTYKMTQPSELHSDSSINFTQPSIAADSQGNLHTVSVGNYSGNNLLYYSLSNSQGDILISETRIDNPGLKNITDPVIAVDGNDAVHVVWADKAGTDKIMYTMINPYLNFTQFDGLSKTDEEIRVIDDTVLVMRTQERGNPHIAIDSIGNMHVVWEDKFDDLQQSFFTKNVYYALYEPNQTSQSLNVLMDATIVSVSPMTSSHPQVTISSTDIPSITWQEPSTTNGIEMVFLVDTSGSMYSEWSDLCAMMYGGNFASGGYFEGIKPIFKKHNVTVYETIYGLGNTLPGAASSGSCTSHNKNTGPRTTPLGIVDGDDSGGIRKLPATVYNGNTYSGYSGEDWGPGSNWACLSWKDAQGNVPGNPPTQDDHKWNPKASRFVLPISDEGPKDGDPSQQADDLTSIEEAHDSCVTAGVIPIGMYGQTYGGANSVQSHFIDLANCPNGVVSTAVRNCPGNTVRSTNAEGTVFEFPSGSGGSSTSNWAYQFMTHMWNQIDRFEQHQIMFKTLDPYNLMQNNLSWADGGTGHTVSGGEYQENLGEFVRVNNSIIVNATVANEISSTHTYGFAHPNIAHDSQDRLLMTWFQTERNVTDDTLDHDIKYAVFDVSTSRTDGVPEGLNFTSSRVLSIPKTVNNLSSKPTTPSTSLVLSDLDKAHIAWIGFGNHSNNNTTHQIYFNSFDLTGTPNVSNGTVGVANLSKQHPVNFTAPTLTSTNGVVFLAWDDKRNCETGVQSNESAICHVRFLDKGVNLNFTEEQIEPYIMYPNQVSEFNLSVDTSVFSFPSTTDEVVSISFTEFSYPWNVTIEHKNNQTNIQNNDRFVVTAGSTSDLTLRLKAPSIYEAIQNESIQLQITASLLNYSQITSTISFDVLLVLNSSITLTSTKMYSTLHQGDVAEFPIKIQSNSNAIEMLDYSVITSLQGDSPKIGITFPATEYIGPGETIERQLRVSTLADIEPGNYSVTINGDTTRTIPGDSANLTIFVEVLPKMEGHIEYILEDFDRFFEPSECRFIKFNVKKLYGDGNLSFELNGAEDARFTDPALYWTYDIKTLAMDRTEFRGPWQHVHNTAGEQLTMKLCAPSESLGTELKTFELQATWTDYNVELNSENFTIIPYKLATWNVSYPENLSLFNTSFLSISGDLLENANAGPVTFEAALSLEQFSMSETQKESLLRLGQLDSQVLLEQGAYSLGLNLTSVLDVGFQSNHTIYLTVSDVRTTETLAISVIYFPDLDGDGVCDGEDAFPLDPLEWLDSDNDGVGDNTDTFPFDGNETVDTDGDGVGDNSDIFPNNSSEFMDSDNDGVGDNSDFDPFNSTIQVEPVLTIEDNTVDEQKSSDSSNDVFLYFGIVLAILLGIIVLLISIIARKKPNDFDAGLYHESQFDETNLIEAAPSPIMSAPSVDMQSNAGINAGYEWLRYDDEMYYRKENEVSEWLKYRNE